MFLDENGNFRMCSSDLYMLHRRKLREQRRGWKKILNVIEDLKTKYRLWLQKRLARYVVKILPELHKSLTKKRSVLNQGIDD